MRVSEYKAKTTESNELRSCLHLLHSINGIVAWRNNTGGTRYKNKDGSNRYVSFGIKGMPDIMGWVSKQGNTTPLYWEVKRYGGKPTELQQKFIDKAAHDGCYVGWGTCEVLENKLRGWGLL